ncbi:hypothetical protein EN833_33465 [Mesorhizobium sp. M4B.F.Ca.ET.190.01.1.1]|uniref:transposase n=1 Tax=Mesorhizobium sp. TaxID=1871066 RepID=UPI000A07C333|nr:hypothetical protein EOA29_03880 [Mesorhizobium sp. M1E.F.Ca.ET.063.01.1.1]RWF38631.1 MAG: hypothetical protein EOS65_22610 [Mesorhizobium sp.]TGQ99257.1 hypothetical protein EN843_33455 [Mesorhizobium sp. M4B.F.Ca.ET.200.01.1.1]TGS11425.1 hypothetical protein EN833_33465 [Mesorhizobium sp. M4B.F.Ca.ET.190.01.1.1]TGT24001.1 hypothetical protein EN815_33535 [Mesorhizobium sp. M4B.F.Ca.ET.172.01.1.1]
MKIEVLGAERRRRWRHEDKIRIVEESFAPGTVVCAVARWHESRRVEKYDCLGHWIRPEVGKRHCTAALS